MQALENELDLNDIATNDAWANIDKSSSPFDYDQHQSQEQFPLIEEPIIPPEPVRPLSHEEYVANRLKNERLPPGFVSLTDRRYLLR